MEALNEAHKPEINQYRLALQEIAAQNLPGNFISHRLSDPKRRISRIKNPGVKTPNERWDSL